MVCRLRFLPDRGGLWSRPVVVIVVVVGVVIVITIIAFLLATDRNASARPGNASTKSGPQPIAPSTTTSPWVPKPAVTQPIKPPSKRKVAPPSAPTAAAQAFDLAGSILSLPCDSPLNKVRPKFERDASDALVAWRGSNSELFPFVDPAGRQLVLRFATQLSQPEQRVRYAAIEKLPERRKRELGLVATQLIHAAITNSDGAELDAVAMERVPGVSLWSYIDANHKDPASMWRLAARLKERFAAGASDRSDGQTLFAHGDLQSGNILVTSKGSVWFVDYDDVYLPGLGKTLGIGHENFQHPRRGPEHWGPFMDTFSAVLIYAAVRAIAAQPSLTDLSSDISVLFTRFDLEHPGDTELWSSLATVKDRPAQVALGQLATWCTAGAPPDEPFPLDALGGWDAANG